MTLYNDRIKIKELLFNLSINLNDFSISRIGSGKNNRTYLISTQSEKFLAKFYFFSSQDKRERLINEFNFLKYVKEIGIKNVPKPIIKSDYHNLGIYEFIDGRAFNSTDLNEGKIIEAASFFSSINNYQYKGKQTLVYTNNSPDDLDKVFYHLYFNAFQPGSEMDIRSLSLRDPDARVGSRIGQLNEK